MTIPHLLDVNVLIALAWPNHVHHRAAREWFRAVGREEWATTPITESGFVRVSSNAVAIPGAVRPAEALGLLARMCAAPGHRFLTDDVELLVGDTLDPARVATHRQVTDAHLLAVAVRHDARLATFDRALAGLGPNGAVTLVPAAA